MKSKSQSANGLYEPDGFHVGRVMALQPHLQAGELCEDVMATEDPRVVGYLTNVLRVWAQSRHDLPHTFSEEIQVTEVLRQPLALVVAEVQHVHRSVREREDPYSGENINSSDWSTDDRFEMQPVDPTVFPAKEQCESFDLAGRESVTTCGECNGACQTTCARCGGLGTLPCEACGGTEQMICPRCDGGGTHLGVSGRYIQCQFCRTRGTVKCNSCFKGQVSCADCVGGQVTCARCEGFGRMKRRWVLRSQTSTLEHRRVNLREPWPLDFSAIHSDMEVAAQCEYAWPTENPSTLTFNGELPSELCDASKDALDTAWQKEPVVNPKEHRITGLRVRVLGTYVYRVAFQFRDRAEQAFICGSTNRVFTARAPIHAPSMIRRILKLGARLYDKAFVTGGVEIDRGYLDAVREARAHIADSKCLIPAVAQILKLGAIVTDNGYQIDIPLSQPIGDKQFIRLLVDLDIDAANRAIIFVHHTLGPAHRDRFPQALEMTPSLSFGRVAVVDLPGTGRQMFEFVDCRLYELAGIHHLATIVSAVAQDISSLYKTRALQ